MSPKNRDKDINKLNKILKLRFTSNILVAISEKIVPDQVFLGLMDGIIKGPPNVLPTIYAIVSLKNDEKIIM